MKPDVSHILTYLMVAEQGSFTKAAEVLKISKSVVSKHIASLEEALACQLLHRSTRKLILTEIGQHYYDSLKTLPVQLDKASDMIHNYQSEPKGTLKVVAPVNFESALKADVLRSFLTKYRKVNLQLEFEKHPENYIDDDVDIIILWKFSEETFPSYNLVTKKLFSMPIGIYASPDYLKEHGTPHEPHDLLNHNCFSQIDFKWPFRMQDKHIEYIEVAGNLITRSVEIIHEATLQSLGIAYSYPFVFQKALQNKSVVKLLDQYTQFNVDINAFYRQSAYRQMKVSAFIQCIQDYYQLIQDEIMSRGMPR